MMKQERVAELSVFERRQIALDARVDPRTLERALSGRAVRLMARERIRLALAAKKLEHLLPAARR